MAEPLLAGAYALDLFVKPRHSFVSIMSDHGVPIETMNSIFNKTSTKSA